MATKNTVPVITHVEILARAIRTIDQEIEDWRSKCDKLPNAEHLFTDATGELVKKRKALKEMYRIETGGEY